MIYNNVRHECNLYNFFYAPRGNRRMMELGKKIAQMYLNPFDRIIGIIGAKDSGKSMMIKGMFPGIQVVDGDDEYDITIPPGPSTWMPEPRENMWIWRPSRRPSYG